MRFHHVCGEAVTLSEDRVKATRDPGSFCDGLVFCEQPMRINERVTVELSSLLLWSGALRIGVTSCDPRSLSVKDIPKFAYPDLSNKEGYWVAHLNENDALSGNKITIYINSHGQLHVFRNNEHCGVYLNNLPTNQSLWIFYDLYGYSNGVRFVLPDDAPKEIQARGPEAVEAYHKSCSSGTQPMYRSRLMLVGKDRVGKTSLKRALTGLSHNKEEKSTCGIDLSSSCSFNLNNRSSWKLAIKGDNAPLSPHVVSRDLGVLGGCQGLEEEYHQALANNIIQELRYKKSLQDKLRPSSKNHHTGSVNRVSNVDKRLSPLPLSSMPKISDIKEIPPDIINSVPERVVHLVQNRLDNPTAENVHPAPTSAATRNKTVVLNIWDFAGQAVYYTTHQVFLTSRAVYVIVFNLCDILTGKETETQEKREESEELSTLEYMDYWMRSIHAHTAENTVNSVDNTQLSPPIFIVGTHRNSLHSDPQQQKLLIDEKFTTIREFITGKTYTQHVITPFFAVENDLDSGDEEEEEEEIDLLRSEIEKIAGRESYMGEQMPIKWLKFEQEITRLADEGTHYATYDQVCDIAANNGISTDTEVETLLKFYHDLGVIIYYGFSSLIDNSLRNTVILNPQWLIDMFRRFIVAKSSHEQWNLLEDKWRRLDMFCILEEQLIDVLWHDALPQKNLLLCLMEKFDLLCKRIPAQGQSHREDYNSYYIPLRLRNSTENHENLYPQQTPNVVFYLDFNSFLPDGLFYRILTRATRWSQENGGRDPYLFRRSARFYIDPEHDFVLEMPAKQNYIKVVILREVDLSNDLMTSQPPVPSVCAKVRNFLESTLCDLRSLWMKRIAYKTCVPCPCDRRCGHHEEVKCQQLSCLHFLDLDECLSNKIVCCDHRRIKTDQFQQWFPSCLSSDFKDPILSVKSLHNVGTNIERNAPDLPKWLKGAAKLLLTGENQDWSALARKMGYKPTKMEKFNDDLNPALALLSDWIISSGNTGISVDMLIIYLEQLKREDVIDVIKTAKESEKESLQIFLSYQWDHQDEVQKLRGRLERSGFTCWMDIGQMGGGDLLNAKIDEGIRNSKVVIACITPKYIVSHLCIRELGLADILQKPIIPVLFDAVIWPPPGGLAVILSQLVYINLKGVGGHGGTGIHGDTEDKYREIIQHVSLHASPNKKVSVADSVYSKGEVVDRGGEGVVQYPSPSHDSSLSSYTDHDILHSTFSEMTLAQHHHQHHQHHHHMLISSDSEARITNHSRAVGDGSGGRQGVQVTKCAVCVIL